MAAFASDFRDGIDINLGVGYVNERTIPSNLLTEAAAVIAAQPEKYRQPFNYGGPHGSPTLIAAIRRFYTQQGLGNLDASTINNLEIAIGANGATSILDALTDLFEPGIVITADPMYYIYCNQLERKGFRVVTVPEDHEGLPAEAIEEKLMSLGEAVADMAFFYVVTVNNPSGTILSNTRKKALVALAERWSQKLDKRIPIFFDQAYEWLIHDPAVERLQSAMLWNNSGLAYEVGTLSKILAPALRIGFILGQRGTLMDAVVQKTSDAGFSAPLLNQEIAAYMLDTHISKQIKSVNDGYRQKAQAVRKGINDILGNAVEECRGGQGGFYFYLTLHKVQTDTASPFFAFLSRTTGNDAIDGSSGEMLPRVIYLPGAFCVHKEGASVEQGKRQLRLSYGYEEVPAILKALHYIREATAYAAAQQKT